MPSWMKKRRALGGLARFMAQTRVRNAGVKNIRPGLAPVTRTGDGSDVSVVDADGRCDQVCCVVFGAAVRLGGEPSGTLRRRVDGAFAMGGIAAQYFVTGGLGRHPPAEAEVMAQLLRAHGVPHGHIVVDAEATDTLASAVNCARLIRAHGRCARVVVCSSHYHMPRCRMLLDHLGLSTSIGSMPSDRPGVTRTKLAYFCLRELVAYPYDFLLVWLVRHNLFRRSHGNGG